MNFIRFTKFNTNKYIGISCYFICCSTTHGFNVANIFVNVCCFWSCLFYSFRFDFIVSLSRPLPSIISLYLTFTNFANYTLFHYIHSYVSCRVLTIKLKKKIREKRIKISLRSSHGWPSETNCCRSLSNAHQHTTAIRRLIVRTILLFHNYH